MPKLNSLENALSDAQSEKRDFRLFLGKALGSSDKANF